MSFTLFWRRLFADFALPLRCNRDAVTVQSRCRYGEMATRLHCNGNAFWPKTYWRRCQRGTSKPFFRSICPCFQVLNFGNNILQFYANAWCCFSEHGHFFMIFSRLLVRYSWILAKFAAKRTLFANIKQHHA